MKGYWNNPGETSRVFTKDGWLLTGDVGYLDKEERVCLFIRTQKGYAVLVSGV